MELSGILLMVTFWQTTLLGAAILLALALAGLVRLWLKKARPFAGLARLAVAAAAVLLLGALPLAAMLLAPPSEGLSHFYAALEEPYPLTLIAWAVLVGAAWCLGYWLAGRWVRLGATPQAAR